MTAIDYAYAAASLLLVLALIALATWGLKKLMQGSSGLTLTGGRRRRLGLVETTAIDAGRKLVLIRRDDVEHLILLSQDRATVVETGIAPPPTPNDSLNVQASSTKPQRSVAAPTPTPHRQAQAAPQHQGDQP